MVTSLVSSSASVPRLRRLFLGSVGFSCFLKDSLFPDSSGEVSLFGLFIPLLTITVGLGILGRIFLIGSICVRLRAFA